MLDVKTRDVAGQASAADIARRVLAREGRLLDLQQWDEWLDCYVEDCVYWVPVWKDEAQLVSDPSREVSLIYHTSRLGLEERVLRVRSRKTVTAMPLPRTVHMVSNILVDHADDARIEGSASWNVQHYDPRVARRTSNCGLYEFTLSARDGTWRIARKKVILLDDMLPAVIDFYGL